MPPCVRVCVCVCGGGETGKKRKKSFGMDVGGGGLDAAFPARTLHASSRASDAGPGSVDRQVSQGAPGSDQVRLLERAPAVLRRHRCAHRKVRPVWIHGCLPFRNAVGGDPGGLPGKVCGGHSTAPARTEEWRIFR